MALFIGSQNDMTALMVASGNGSLEIVKALLAAGAEKDTETNVGGSVI